VAHGETVTLPGERKQITLDSKVLSRYPGAYRMSGGPVMLITLDGNQLSGKLDNQPALEIYPESETRFFLKAVDAQIEFSKDDGQGPASQLTLHQNGREMTGKRLDEAQAKGLADAAAAFARRLKDQTPAPGSEAAVRKMIADLQAGKPDESVLSPGAPIHQQLSQLQSEVSKFGAIQSIAFKAVGPAGPDIYLVKTEKGTWEYRVWLAPDGKVEQANARPAQ